MSEQSLGGEIFAAPDEAELRHEPRQKTLKHGDIVFEQQQCLMTCLVMDLSAQGAKLKPGDPLHCPPLFALRVGEDKTHLCHVAWRSGDYVGVRFVDELSETC